MFTFKLSALSKNIWQLCFRTKEEINRDFYGDKPIDSEMELYSVTNYATQTVYIDKNLDGFPLMKVIRRELMHIYLWETGQQNRICSTEEVCDLMSTAAPIICKTADEIILRLKEGLYKKGE